MTLLKKLKKAQACEGNVVYVDFDEGRFYPVETNAVTNVATPLKRKRERKVKFKEPPETIYEVFLYLEQRGYIRHEGRNWDYVTVTHTGNHIIFEYLSIFAQFLLKSILVPIFVALATTLITNAVIGLIS